jgi:hypothetical protein
MTIDGLILKQDNFEIVRDQICGILRAEVISQMAFAPLYVPPQDPELWNLLVYRERALPWERYLAVETPPDILTPIINVVWDSQAFDAKASDVVRKQATDTTYHIDCYGFAIARDVAGGGHEVADKSAALEAQRAYRLCRNILMSAEYVHLGLTGLVSQRFPKEAQALQPEETTRSIVRVSAVRFPLEVRFPETAPQISGMDLESVLVTIKEDSTGQVLLEAEFT